MNRSSKEDMEYKANLEENFLKHIGYEYTKLLCEELDGEMDKIDAVNVPESLDEWFANFHKQELKYRRKSVRKNKVLSILKRAAVVILVIIAINYILVASVEAYRIKFLNTIVKIKEKFTQIDVIYDKTDEKNIPDEWEGRYYPSYIPEGYALTDKFVHEETSTLFYSNNYGDDIIIKQIKNDVSLRIDTESKEAVTVTVGMDKNALYLKKDISSSLIWRWEDTMFTLISDKLDLDILIKIAESVKIKK